MQKRLCKHCEHELYEVDDLGNPGWWCPNNCITKIAMEKNAEEFIPDDVVPNRQEVDRTNCWYCDKRFLRLPELQDSPYGHFCPYCRHSLRDNPIYGVGKPRDSSVSFHLA
jgi:hypothetical protein